MSDSLSTQDIHSLIQSIRGQRVILASDLAKLYGVQTKRLNEQVRRNPQRFPSDFMFQLTADEVDTLISSRSQFATLKKGENIKYRPYAFTEHGAIMAANVLNSAQAVAMSVYVVRAFIQQRETIAANKTILKKLAEIDKTLLQHNASLREIYQKLLPLLQPPPDPPKPQIGFRERSPRYGFARPSRR
ncbi:MAG: ORF6N domain-containing protein [Methylacidiphilales bacterium]|nr:ORF6N domain-containing protein [Candidatus Methylacidiphilales bacterium]